VTHTPTLQPRIIEAASDVTKISPPLEALMFSIYCVAIFSLSHKECQTMFDTPREDLLASYQLGAREALLNCGFWRTSDRDCLTALHFYLVRAQHDFSVFLLTQKQITIKPMVDPRALLSILGATIRIAQRMGIHDESANSKQPALEAELRRRLWWSLVLFDARISEMTDFRLGMLLPTWDCRPPSNTNDFDFRLEMKIAPQTHSVTSEALFVVVRSEIGNFIRRSSFHLDFINPALKSVAQSQATSLPDTDDIVQFGKTIEGKYLQYCDPQNPLHYMTIWWARGQLAKSCFVKDLSESSKTATQRTNAQLDATISHALNMLECDTRLMSSKLTTGCRWLIYLYFPFPAYVHLLQDLSTRPFSDFSGRSWRIMSENCAARFMEVNEKDMLMGRKDNPFFSIFAAVVLRAWEAHEAAVVKQGYQTADTVPDIVMQVKSRLATAESKAREIASMQQDDLGMDDVNLLDSSEGFSMGGGVLDGLNDSFPIMPLQHPTAFDSQGWEWPTGDYHAMIGQGW
jgi:hypothetical protein